MQNIIWALQGHHVKEEENMSFYNKILFPVDLTDASSKIAPHVKGMADQFGAEIHMIYVAHVTQYYDGLYISPYYIGDFETEVVKAARSQLEKFQVEYFKGVSVKTKIITGYPGEEILNYVTSEGIDLIIMGHSREGIKRLILGSVAGNVVKWSPVPVMIVNPHT